MGHVDTRTPGRCGVSEPRYRDSLPATAELVVIGGGIMGAATAFYAARAGIRAVLLERRPALCTLTTAAATGGFRLQFDNAVELDLVRRSVELFLHFAEITGQRTYDPEVRQRGYLWLTTEPAMSARQRELVARQHGWGQRDIEILSGDEVRYRFPYVGEGALQARWRQGDGSINPRALAMGLLAASGAAVVLDCDVRGIRDRGGRLVAVETNSGAVRTERAVIAAGPLSGLLAAEAGISLPITTVRRQKLTLPEVPEVPPDAPMTIDEDTGVHWRPALRGAAILHSDSATPPSAPAEWVPVDGTMPFRVLDPRSPISVARLAPFWRAVWERNTAQWALQAGQYTMTPDHLPLIGPTAVEGLWVNTGYSGHGVMAGPAGSELLIELLTGARSGLDNPFRPDRPFVERIHASL